MTIPVYQTTLVRAGASWYHAYWTGRYWRSALDNTGIPTPSHAADHEKRAWVRIEQPQREPEQRQLF